MSAFRFVLDVAFAACLLSSALLTSQKICLRRSMKVSSLPTPSSTSIFGSALSSGVREWRLNKNLNGDIAVDSDGSGRVCLIRHAT